MKNLLLLFILSMPFTFLHAQEIQVKQVQNVLMTKKTASWCPPCGSWGWDTFEALLDADIDHTIFLAAHYSSSNDVLYTPSGEEIVANFESTFSRPAFFVNNKVVAGSSNDALNKIKDGIADAAAIVPTAQTGIQATYATGSRTIDVATRTQFFTNTDGEFRLGVYIVKKSMISYQASQGNDANHKEVLRDEITDGIFGEVITTGSVTANTSVEQQFSFDLGEEDELENIEILTLIWQKDGESFQLINSNITDDITEAVVNNLDDTAAQQGFSVYPTTIVETAQIELNLTEKAIIDLTVFDVKGQLVQSIFNGAINSGVQKFELEKNTLSVGVYFVRLQLNGQIFNRKIVIR